MARCSQCNKFASFDELRTDEVEIEISGLAATMTGTVYRPCADCGTDLVSADVDASVDVEELFPEIGESKPDEIEYEISGFSIEATERQQDTDRKGKKIKNPRYMKNFIGVEGTATVERTATWMKNGVEQRVETEDVEITLEWECQASGFDEC